ncbi:hypothetical protein ACIOHC_43070 [Streptomyces sp. NPDC088252]|uniref:hypothetical protein n=1 Tax=unclassified Streptomyces TaxID=2593676 RepID=UPI0038236681
MNSRTHLAIDGYVDAIPAAGVRWGTATFDLIHSPADVDRVAPDDPDTAYACTTEDPRLADVLVREIQPGDLLRVTGTLTQPDVPEAPAHLTVDGLEVLEAAPAAVLFDLVLERWGNYVSVFDADRDAVPVFTVSGAWVGESASPDAIGDLIDAAHRDDDHCSAQRTVLERFPAGHPRGSWPADEYAAAQRAQGRDACRDGPRQRPVPRSHRHHNLASSVETALAA